MFISFEGIDGSGKTTVLERMRERCTARNIPVCVTREPGGSALGARIRTLVVGGSEDCQVSPRAELFLFLADRAQHVAEVIRPELDEKRLVLCDRYVDSMIAYQGYGRGLDVEELRILNLAATGNLLPDRTILLDLPVECAMERVRERMRVTGTCTDVRFDLETYAFHERIRQGYLAEAARDPGRFICIDASDSKDTVSARCQEVFVSLDLL